MTWGRLTLVGFAAVFVCLCPAAQSLSVAQAEARTGRVDAAVQALQAGPRDAASQSLLCSLYLSVDELDPAISACEAAVAAAPTSSDYNLALARAYGIKAERGGALTGMRLVGKIRGGFQKAVQQDGKNVEALSDLGQFYVEAPGVAGGGVDKAGALLPQLGALSQARAHRLTAMIAAKNKDDAGAEQAFQAEVATAQTAEAYVDLAGFYRDRKRPADAAKFAKLAIEHDPQHGPDTLDAAGILQAVDRDPAVVQSALRAYLKTPQKNVANYAKAHMLLGKSLRATGDGTAAMGEFKAALALARGYQPAKQELGR